MNARMGTRVFGPWLCWRPRALMLAGLLLGALAQAAPVVVTPGSNAGYLYFPPASVGSGGSGNNNPINQGTGGVIINKGTRAAAVDAAVFYDYVVQVGNTTCGNGCQTKKANTGSGYVTITSSVPAAFSAASGNCSGVTTCQIWVAENTSVNVAVDVHALTWTKDASHSVSGPGGQACAQASTSCQFYLYGTYAFTLSSAAYGAVNNSLPTPENPATVIGVTHNVSSTSYGAVYATRLASAGCSPTNKAACTTMNQVVDFSDGTYGAYVAGATLPFAVYVRDPAGGPVQWMPTATDTSMANVTSVGAASADYPGPTTSPLVTSLHARCTGTAGAAWRAASAGEAYRVVNSTAALVNRSAGRYFWTTSEYNAGYAWLMNDTSGNPQTQDKTLSYYVMCVRSL